MNEDLSHEEWSAAMAEATTPLVAETRQEKAILTGNYAGSVEAILMDMDVHEKLEKISENLESAHALLQSEETRNRAENTYALANHDIIKLEKIELTGAEKARLFELTNRLIEIGFEFAAPAHAMKEHADMKCPE